MLNLHWFIMPAKANVGELRSIIFVSIHEHYFWSWFHESSPILITNIPIPFTYKNFEFQMSLKSHSSQSFQSDFCMDRGAKQWLSTHAKACGWGGISCNPSFAKGRLEKKSNSQMSLALKEWGSSNVHQSKNHEASTNICSIKTQARNR